MAQSILKIYLRLNLLELAGDDSRLDKLSAAASQLAGSLARTPASAVPLLLACLKDELGGNQVFEATAQAIENQWPTYTGAFKDAAPTTLYRAVSLQALAESIEAQPVLGTAIALLMRNFSPYVEAGKNQAALDILLGLADATFQAEGIKALGEERPIAFTSPVAAVPTKVARPEMRKRIEAAVGPHNRANEAGKDPNQHFPNAGNPWSFDFSDRLAIILADYIDVANKWAADLDAKNLQSTASKLGDFVIRRDAPIERTAMLLWWRQALYSESAEQPYRELPLSDALAHAVVDLAALSGSVCKPALESFLMETIRAISPTQDTVTLEQLLPFGLKASAALRECIALKAPTGLLLAKTSDATSSFAYPDISLSPCKWAVWLLREVKAFQALEAPYEIAEEVEDEDEGNE